MENTSTLTFNRKEAARRLGISVVTLDREIAKKKMPHFRVGRRSSLPRRCCESTSTKTPKTRKNRTWRNSPWSKTISMNVDPDKLKGQIEEGCYQPSLFDDEPVEANRTQHFVVPRFSSKRKRKRSSPTGSNKVVNLRAYRGEQIASRSQIQRHKDYYLVPSQSGEYSYAIDAKTYTCECADFQLQRQKCKHIIAIEIAFGKSRHLDTRQLCDAKYTQNWQAYNKSQTLEKSMFLGLLSELTHKINEPEQMNGRPAINLGDMVFACVFKVYSQMSSRRFSTDLKDAAVKGYINEVPHFSSLNRHMEKASLIQYFEALIEETAKPLAALETDFAIDSTGLSISNTVAWSHAKHKDAKFLQSKNWVKVHCCVGTHTNIIASVVITDKTSHDSEHFIQLLDNTRRNFEVREVSADAAYSNNRNLNFATMKNIGTFIPFKDRTSFNNRRSTASGIAYIISFSSIARSSCRAMASAIMRNRPFICLSPNSVQR